MQGIELNRYKRNKIAVYAYTRYMNDLYSGGIYSSQESRFHAVPDIIGTSTQPAPFRMERNRTTGLRKIIRHETEQANQYTRTRTRAHCAPQ